MSPAPARVDRFEQEDLHIVAESWLIDRYNLSENPNFVEFMQSEVSLVDTLSDTDWNGPEPDYIVRLLPYLREHCQDEDEQLDPTKFRDILIILNTISLFYQEDDLGDDEDTKIIYIEMCTKFCEWLITRKDVMEFFNQDKIIEDYEYADTPESVVKSRRVRFNKNAYLNSIWNKKRKILQKLISDTFETVEEAESFDFVKLDRIAPWKETRFSQSLIEWFDLMAISDIKSHFSQNESYGLFSRGFKRFDEWNPRYRLIIYSSLIRQTYALNSQTCFMFNKDIILKLRDLIRAGHLCLQDKAIFEEFDNFWVEDLLYDFQMLSQTSSLFLEQTTIDIFHHCSSMELLRNPDLSWYLHGCFQRSVLTKTCLALSGIDSEVQRILVQQSRSFYPKFGEVWEDVIPDEYSKSIHINGHQFSNGIGGIINKITPENGLSAVRRMKEYKSIREQHNKLYDQLGIPTSIPSITRGRRTNVLFYHQNKDQQKLLAEIEYLPESLNAVMKRFNDSNSVISAPYLVIITFAHVLQFSQCINSLGSFSNPAIIAKFGDEINHIIGVLDKWGFLSTTSCLADIRDLFRHEDDLGRVGELDTIGRAKVIEIQTRLKEIYDNVLHKSLHFPTVIPPELSPHFSL